MNYSNLPQCRSNGADITAQQHFFNDSFCSLNCLVHIEIDSFRNEMCFSLEGVIELEEVIELFIFE